MDPPPLRNRRTASTARPDLWVLETDDGSRTLVVAGTENTFHSGTGAVSETRHVSLQLSGAEERLRAGLPTSVLEVGSGTGWGILLTVDLALQQATPLHLVSLEVDWPPAGVLAQLEQQSWLATPGLASQFLDFRRSADEPAPGSRLTWQPAPGIQVDVALQSVLDWSPPAGLKFDAIYYDPFAPQAAPELWAPSTLARIRRWVANDGRLSTYACARSVRDAFAQSGWAVSRVPGPVAGKREVLVARPAMLPNR